jgi:hypothetical protein
LGSSYRTQIIFSSCTPWRFSLDLEFVSHWGL